MDQDQGPIDPEWSLLTRYLTGQLSPAETAAVERWFEADPRHRALLDELRGVWAATGGETEGWNTERAVAELRRRALGPAPERRAMAGRGVTDTRARRAPSFTLPRKWPWAALAAGVAALLIGGGLGLYFGSRGESSTVAGGISGPATDVSTRPGQRAEVRLADGSRVTLGPASRLRYASDFGRRDRTVILEEGEAYLNVVHDNTKPFRLRTAQGIVEDIGTAFVVRARAGTLRVVVAEGAVVLRPAPSTAVHDSVLLTAGQLGRVLRDGRLDTVRTVKPEAYLAWMRDELVFEDVPLVEVAEELNRWYGVEVRVADSATASRRFSGRFARRSVEEMVQLIARVADVSVRRTERGWSFHGRRAP